ncbi:hypothetical protein J6590_031983 [Homalodisca vitripennis]|nr:hypothetical protein J6590_031983 [Homalodisca vitripennis]
MTINSKAMNFYVKHCKMSKIGLAVWVHAHDEQPGRLGACSNKIVWHQNPFKPFVDGCILNIIEKENLINLQGDAELESKLIFSYILLNLELSYRKPLPIFRQRSKSSGLVDNVIAESRRPFSWCVYFRVLPLHFSKHKNSTKTKLFIEKNTQNLFLFLITLRHPICEYLRPSVRSSTAPSVLPRADVNERKTSLEIVSISKISNSRGADQKYKLNCNGKAIMYRAKKLNNHVMPRGLPQPPFSKLYIRPQKSLTSGTEIEPMIPRLTPPSESSALDHTAILT